MTNINIVKRDGTKSPLDLAKIHKVVTAACEGLTGVSVSELELNSRLKFANGMKSSDIQETLIRSAADLITIDAPNYQFVAGRLVNYQLRKEVYGTYNPPKLIDIVKRGVKAKLYTSELLEWYNEADWEQLEKIVDHTRDDTIAYAGMQQFRSKYLLRNRATGKFFETPQVAYILVAATIFHNTERYPDRMKWIKDLYDASSKGYISLASPVIGGVRTRTKQFASCVLIESGDSLDSITESITATAKYIAKRAGIGFSTTAIRDLGDDVADGYAQHTGKPPYIRFVQGASKSASQGGMRGGATTVNVLGWSREIMDMLQLKNNKGSESHSARQVDYVVQINRLFYERLRENANITLMSPSHRETPGLLDAFYGGNYEVFKALYEQYEKSPRVAKKVVTAHEFFVALMNERKDTGRIYLMNMDNVSSQGMYRADKAPVRMTNLCVEVLQHTAPIKYAGDPDGRIALCVLAAVNWGIIKTTTELSKYTRLASYALDELISYQDYLLPAAERATMEFRSVGVGLTNLAYFLAKHGYPYEDISAEGLALIDEWAEAHTYGSLLGAVERAEKWGPCERWEDTHYAEGLMPHDRRKPAVDTLTPMVERQDWDDLRSRVVVSGIRNNPNNAQMPTETSSQAINATSGTDPITALVVTKKSGTDVLTQVAPEAKKYQHAYNILGDQRSMTGLLHIHAIIQKWFDSGMSVNINYNSEHWPKGLPMSVMVGDTVTHYKYGGKTMYYLNTGDRSGEVSTEEVVSEDETEDPDKSCCGA